MTWEELQIALQSLSRVFDAPCPSPNYDHRKSFEEYLREHEFGLALQTICDYLVDVGVPVEPVVMQEIEHLHTLMQMTDDDLSQLRRL